MIDQLCFIVDLANGNDGVASKMRVDQKRLRLIVRNRTDSGIPGKFFYIPFKFCPERGILYIMNTSLKSVFSIDRHAAAACPQVRMIVCAEKQVEAGCAYVENGSHGATHIGNGAVEGDVERR